MSNITTRQSRSFHPAKKYVLLVILLTVTSIYHLTRSQHILSSLLVSPQPPIKEITSPVVPTTITGTAAAAGGEPGSIRKSQKTGQKEPVLVDDAEDGTHATADTIIVAPKDGTSGVESLAVEVVETNGTDCCSEVYLKEALIEWILLCNATIAKTAHDIIARGDDLVIAQIGAHTGYEENDPIASSLTSLINEFDDSTRRKKISWTFVEPSLANYKGLVKNLALHSDVCNMNSINAAVVSDSTSDADIESLVFYSIKDSIDPVTGLDSLSGKKLPSYITQLSSFNKENILYNRREFSKNGLNVHDYIVETNVTSMRYSDLMQEASGDKGKYPFLVLVDTEGFDCKIILGIGKDSPFLPQYLIFEHKGCPKEDLNRAVPYLQSLGYTVQQADGDNMVAWKSK